MPSNNVDIGFDFISYIIDNFSEITTNKIRM